MSKKNQTEDIQPVIETEAITALENQDENPVAPISEETPEPVPSKTEQVIAAINAGGKVTLDEDLIIEGDALNITSGKTVEIDLGGFKIKPAGNSLGVSVNIKNTKVTLKNGEIVPNTSNSRYGYGGVIVAFDGSDVTVEDITVTGVRGVYAVQNCSVLIKSGTFICPEDCEAIYNERATAKITIEDGFFKSNHTGSGNDLTINVYDPTISANPGKKPSEFIAVKGGKFFNFNPAECHSEPKSVWEVTNFTVDGTTVGYYTDGGTIYWVKENDGTWPETTDDGKTVTWPDKPEEPEQPEEPGEDPKDEPEDDPSTGFVTMTPQEIQDEIYKHCSEEEKRFDTLNFTYTEPANKGIEIGSTQFKNSVKPEELWKNPSLANKD